MIKKLLQRKNLLFSYGLLVFWFLLILLVNNFLAMAPWTLVLTFFGLLVIPGYAIIKLLKIRQEEGFDNFVFYLTAGLVFNLVLAGLAMLLGVSIFVLEWLIIAATILLLATALFQEWHRPAKQESFKWSWQAVFNLNHLNYLVVILISAVVVIGVGIQGSLFRGGDANFHLSILRKAFEGSSLSPQALGFVKSETIHVAYGVPVWHIFLGLLGRLTHADPYLIWKTVSIPLSVLTIFIWYWLGKIFFQSRFMALVGLVFFVNYIFNWNTGYLFTVLPVPDSLNNYLLFPWVVGLFLIFIFRGDEKFGNWKILGLLVLFSLLMAAIHLTQFIYLLILALLFAVIWAALFWQDKDYRKVLRRVAVFFGANLVFLIPAFIFMQVKAQIIQLFLEASAKPVKDIKYREFAKLGTPGKFALILLPLALPFLKKQRLLVFLLATFVLLLLTFSAPVSHALSKTLSFIFTNRIYGSVIWHWLVMGLGAGIVILSIDRGVKRLPKTGRWTAGIIALLAVGFLIYSQAKWHVAAKSWDWLFSDQLDEWMISHYLWVGGGMLLGAAAVFAWQYLKPKFTEHFQFKEPQNSLLALAGIIVITVIMFGTTYTYGWDYIKMFWGRPYLFQPATTVDFRHGDDNFKNTVRSVGGPETLQYIQANIKPKSVFLVPGGLVYTFPTLVDQFMVDYPRSKVLSKTQELYSAKKQIGLEEALSRLKIAKTQYILLNDAPDENQAFFDAYPEYFEKIFSGDGVIYRFIE